MTRKFKAAQLKVEQGFSKLGNKLKKVLSPKEQFSAPKPDELCVQDVHPQIAAPQNSFANCTEQASAPNEPSVSTKLGTEKPQSSTNISHAFPATPPKPTAPSLQSEAQETQQEAQPPCLETTAASTARHSTHSSNTGYSTPTPTDKLNTKNPRNTLNRSTSLPAAPSSPSATPASTITYLNTPRHSPTSPFPTPVKPRQNAPKHNDPHKTYQNALAEHLQDEESQAQTTDWAAVVQWITCAHRAEMTKLTQKHAVELEQLYRDRDQHRGRLGMRSGTWVEATATESGEGVLLGCVYSYVVLGIKGLAWFLRRPATFY